MNKNLYLLLALAFAVILSIFLFIPTKKRKTSEDTQASKLNYTLVQYQSDFYLKQSDSIKLIIRGIEEKIAKANDSATKINALTEGIAFYTKLESPEIASLLIYDKAEVIKNTNSWKISGDNFIALLADMKLDTSLIVNVSEYATKSYEKSVQLDSNNTEAKIQLAQCYMEMGGQPMNGVQLLLGIVRKDSKNIKAQLLLAKFGLVSGQYEKVLERLQNVLSLQPQNRDALLMRAEAYAQTGKSALAAKDLRVVLNDSKTPQMMKKQLEMAIKDLETKN